MCNGKVRVSIMRFEWLRQRLGQFRGKAGQQRARGFQSPGLLARLAVDRAGNALAIVTLTAFMVITLAGLGTDMARAYLTKTSLQNACDAGVLAGRKAMAASGTYGSTEQAKANKMFNFNINENATESSTAVFTSSADTTGHVTATASTTMPTTLMRLMGYTSIPLSVQCSAELQMANADVMFVLDTTGSMADNPDGTSCSGSCTTSKIAGLRSAVRSFYQTVATAVTDKTNTRIRFGFVPYSWTANVKDLVTTGSMPSSYLRDSAPYQTALVQFSTTPVTVSGQSRYLAKSFRYIQSTLTTSNFKAGSVYIAPVSNIVLSTGKNNSSATYVTKQPSSSNPYYSTIDIANGTTTTGTFGNYGTPMTYTWKGCVEERASVPQLSMSPIPSGAYDMDVTTAPTNDSTRWPLYLDDSLVYNRGTYTTYVDTSSQLSYMPNYGYSTCPAPMKLFTTVDTTQPTVVPSWLTTYLNNLTTGGGTYHDVGMIWGARLGNPNGMFSSNVNAGNLPSVSRHIIFMTDGTMDNTSSGYTAWGVTRYDGRDAPTNTSDSSLLSYHNNRFLAACTLAKNMGYTVWVVGFGQTLTTQMQSCATTTDKAFYASNTTKLTTTFQYIAGQVADLRLNK